MKATGIILAAVISCASIVRGAIAFTENFSDNSPGPHMALGTGFGSPTTDFTGDFTVTSGESHRIYLGTNDTDYATVSFTYEATVTMPASTSPWGVAFFGMGSRNAAGGVGEPANPDILGVIRPDVFTTSTSPQFENRDNAGTQVNAPIPNSTPAGYLVIPSPSSLSHRLRLTWDVSTQQALLQLDFNYTGGPFTADYSLTVNGADNGLTGSNSRLLLGGGNGVTFDDISVDVPEPASMTLLAVGALLFSRRRLPRG